MKKKFIIFSIVFALVLAGCTNTTESSEYQKFSKDYYGPQGMQVFDTVITLIGYTKTKEEFDKYFDLMSEEFVRYHKLFDIYNSYEGINNANTINDRAGQGSVKVDRAIIDLLNFSIKNYENTSGKTNIAMGSVLKIWHDSRQEIEDYRETEYERLHKEAHEKGEEIEIKSEDIAIPEDILPNDEKLKAASAHMDISKIKIDEEASTVFLEDPDMRIDLGGVAKGFATERIAKTLEEAGFESGIISAGGNVRTVGKPMKENTKHWGIGIQNPDLKAKSNVIETFFVDLMSVVTSGDYQRVVTVNGKKFHHIIDPDTLRPAEYFASVTVLVKDSGLADFLSTALFVVDEKTGREILSRYEGAEAMWVDSAGNITYTQGIEKMMKSKGASANK